MVKVAVTTLGCPKNVADSEAMLGALKEGNFEITEDAAGADVLVVNTCGFLKAAEEESGEIIDQAVMLKKSGGLKKIVVAGCLVQRWPDRIFERIPQVDAVVGVNDFFTMPEIIGRLMNDRKRVKRVSDIDEVYMETGARSQMTPPHYAYLKISEGCSHQCRFCVIPSIKGKLRSRDPETVVAEARRMVADGVKEINIVAQDTTEYLKDRGVKDGLAELLPQICRIGGDFRVRVLYTYPAHWSERLIKVFASEAKICKYVDMPIQHINSRILGGMGREDRREDIEELLIAIRGEIPEVVIRTSVIVGYPGESDEEFEELLEFMREVSFERLGAFIFSPEEGVAASAMPDQIGRELKEKRFDAVMRLQQEISLANNRKMLGRRLRVLVDQELEDSDYSHIGRSGADAPEVDGAVYLRGEGLAPGRFVDVRIGGYMEYDLVGDVTG